MLFKYLRILAACGSVFLLAGGTQATPPVSDASAGAGRITAIFSGLQGSTGYLRVSLFNASGFPDGVPLARRDISLSTLGAKTPGPLTITFAGLRPGAYAVCAFHDRDGSGRLAQNFLGIPQEEWGMSGNPRPRYRAPRFGEVEIGLNARQAKTASIMLHVP